MRRFQHFQLCQHKTTSVMDITRIGNADEEPSPRAKAQPKKKAARGENA